MTSPALKPDVDRGCTEPKVPTDNLSRTNDTAFDLLSRCIETGFADLEAAIAEANAAQLRRINVYVGAIVAATVVIAAGIAAF